MRSEMEKHRGGEIFIRNSQGKISGTKERKFRRGKNAGSTVI